MEVNKVDTYTGEIWTFVFIITLFSNCRFQW